MNKIFFSLLLIFFLIGLSIQAQYMPSDFYFPVGGNNVATIHRYYGKDQPDKSDITLLYYWKEQNPMGIVEVYKNENGVLDSISRNFILGQDRITLYGINNLKKSNVLITYSVPIVIFKLPVSRTTPSTWRYSDSEQTVIFTSKYSEYIVDGKSIPIVLVSEQATDRSGNKGLLEQSAYMYGVGYVGKSYYDVKKKKWITDEQISNMKNGSNFIKFN